MDQRVFRIRANGLHNYEVVEHIIYDDGRVHEVEVVSHFTERYLAEKEAERLSQQQNGGG